MDVVNAALQKGQEARKKKQVSNVQNEEVQVQRGKGIQQSNQVPRKVTFKSSSYRSEHVEIVVDEVSTPTSKSKNKYCIRNMVEGVSIPDEGIVDLDGTPSRHKRRRYVVTESNVIPNYESENMGKVGKSLLQVLV